MDAPELWATNPTDQQRAVRGEMIEQWAQEKRNALWGEIEGSLPEPSLVDVRRTSVGGTGDVRSSYRPHGVDRIGRSGPGGGAGAGARIIEEGRTRLSDDKTSAEAARTNRVAATDDLQSEVSRDYDRGFFTDPDLRK